MARQNQQRRGAKFWREPLHEPERNLRALARARVHQGGALLACLPANSGTRIEQRPHAKCTDEPPAIGRTGEILPAGLNRRKPNRLKKVLCFRPPTGRSLSLPQELGDYAWRSVALPSQHLRLPFGRINLSPHGLGSNQLEQHWRVLGYVAVFAVVWLARSERFELPTLGIEIRCSIQLSYERINVFNVLAQGSNFLEPLSEH